MGKWFQAKGKNAAVSSSETIKTFDAPSSIATIDAAFSIATINAPWWLVEFGLE